MYKQNRFSVFAFEEDLKLQMYQVQIEPDADTKWEAYVSLYHP